MGLFKNKVAELTVEFYDNPKDSLGPSPVHVSYWTQNGSIDILALHFSVYSSKILFNLGDSVGKKWLQEVLRINLLNGFTKQTDLLNGPNYHLILIEQKPSPTKRYQGFFYDNNTLKTPCSIGQEDYFAPMSVIAFLQYFINSLNEDQLNYFYLCLMQYVK